MGRGRWTVCGGDHLIPQQGTRPLSVLALHRESQVITTRIPQALLREWLKLKTEDGGKCWQGLGANGGPWLQVAC